VQAIFEGALGQEHYEVALSLNNLAAIHLSRDDEADALEARYRRPQE
jgi:hypothetical protein